MTKVFSTFWILTIGLILLIFYFFSTQEVVDLPPHARFFADIMLYYLFFACIRTVVLLALSLYENLMAKNLPELDHLPLVTVLVPCYNEGKVIQSTIHSLLKIEYPNLEILVIDDGSPDDTFEKALAATDDPRVRVITKANGGKSNALNYGIEQALGEYVLCMDADSELSTNVITEGLPYFMQYENLAAVAGTVEVAGNKNILQQFQYLEYVIGLNFHKKAQSALNAVNIVPGPIGLFKRECLLEVGCYDDDTFAEDCDLTIKLLARGYNIKYCSTMVAYTEAPDTFYQLSLQRYRWSRGMIQAIIKNLGDLFKQRGFRNFLILIYMTIETLLIPSINFLFAMLTLVLALSNPDTSLYGPFFFGLIVMDATVALYSFYNERRLPPLFFLSIISRVTFGFALEIMRFFSMIDELFKIPMKWGTLERKGMK